MYYLIYRIGSTTKFLIVPNDTPQEDIFRPLPSSIIVLDFFKSDFLHPRDFRNYYLRIKAKGEYFESSHMEVNRR